MTFPRRAAAVVLALVLATAAVFLPVARFEFLNYDDGDYVVRNPAVSAGLTAEGVRWALTAVHAHNWHPLTWISHMVDVQLFGMRPGAHHLVNVALHAANAAAVYLLLAAMTGAAWRSAAVAALFAVHPLHVEAVAWIAERKELLATFFWLAATASHVRYARRGGTGAYLATAGACALGLAAKPTVVTLPFALLLLDYWPLGRLRLPGDRRPGGAAPAPARVLLEKVPLLALAASVAAITYAAQAGSGAVTSVEGLPIGARLANAAHSYGGYLAKTILPVKLAVFYPHPEGGLPWGRTAGWALALVLATVVALRGRRRRPWLAVGWLWYLGTLVPVIGLVQAGSQAMADRYTYVPLLGVFVAAVWGAARLRELWRVPVPAAALGAAAVVAVLAAAARHQVGWWRSSEALFTRALAVTEGNWLAHHNLGLALESEGRLGEAIGHYRAAIALVGDFGEAHNNLGLALEKAGRPAEAEEHFRAALRIDRRDVEARISLAGLLARRGDYRGALGALAEARAAAPADPRIPYSEGTVFGRQERWSEAAGRYREALRLDGRFLEAHNNLATVLARLGRAEEALEHFGAALRLGPPSAIVHSNMGAILLGMGRRAEAAEHFREALRIGPDSEEARRGLRLALEPDRPATVP